MRDLTSALNLDEDRIVKITEKIAELATKPNFHIEHAERIVRIAETKEEAYAAGVIAATIASDLSILENPVKAIASALMTARTLEAFVARRANSN